MSLSTVSIWWGDSLTAGAYDPKALSPADLVRAGAVGPRKTPAWRASRALMVQCGVSESVFGASQPRSLSHSGHCAVLAITDLGVVGIDLECMKDRDVLGLASLSFTPVEMTRLVQLTGPGQTRFFYVLWTLKEALLKASGLAFPADLKSIGLSWVGDDAARGLDGSVLRAPGAAAWWGASFLVRDPVDASGSRSAANIVSVVGTSGDTGQRVPGREARHACSAPDAPRLVWHAGPRTRLPRIHCVASWAGRSIPV